MAMNMKKFERLVQKKVSKALGHVTTHRVYFKGTGLTASSRKTIGLLRADDDPDYDLISDGTNIAECESNAKITKIELRLEYYNSTGAGNTLEYMVYRNQDNSFNASDFVPANLFTSDYTATLSEIKKNTILYNHAMISANFETVKQRLTIKRKALARVRNMRDMDELVINFELPAGTTQNLNLIGRIWTITA